MENAGREPFQGTDLRAMVDNAPKGGLPAAGYSARLVTDRVTAQRLADFFTESLDDVVVAAFESGGGQWTTAVYFSGRPNETATRALVALEMGAELANALVFERVEAKDWVAASLEGLAPVAAGRFLVHGRHDRARVRANRIGIEIEAALAFGTGHHGTTRGCLLALDHLVKRPQTRSAGTAHPRCRHRYRRARHRGCQSVANARVLASDIDPRALTVARENARLNTAAAAIEFVRRSRA